MAELADSEQIKKLRKLHAAIVARRPVIEKAAAYYDGQHNLAFSGEEFQRAFGGLFHAFADNWCGIVADAVAERMNITGFRVNRQPKTDDEAWRIWERNELSHQSGMGHTDGLVVGAFYATAWPDADGLAEITVDAAASTIVETHPKQPRRRTCALRTWIDDDGYEHAELFYPDAVWLFRSRSKRVAGVVGTKGAWIVDDHPDVIDKIDADGRMANPYGLIPVVPFVNRPRLYVSPRVGWAAHSEIASIVPLQDTANKLLADLLVASEFGAFPQRNLTGYEPDTDAETGEEIPPKFESGPGKVWWITDPQGRFGEFQAASLPNYVQSIEMVVQHIASISSTPAHYLRASADRLSGESLKSSETGLVAKVNRRLANWSSPWEEIMRIAGTIEQIDALKGAERMETVWKDPETRTEAEHVDALGKKAQMLSVPLPQLWEEAGYSPEQVKRFPAMNAQMELDGLVAQAARNADTGTRPPLRAVPSTAEV